MDDVPKKTGRPKGSGAIVWDEKQKEQAGKLAGIGCNLEQIAHIMGVSPKTLDNIIDRDPDVSYAISKGRDIAANAVMQTAYDMAVSGKVPAMTMFWLKTRQRWSEYRELLTEGDRDKINEFQMSYRE